MKGKQRSVGSQGALVVTLPALGHSGLNFHRPPRNIQARLARTRSNLPQQSVNPFSVTTSPRMLHQQISSSPNLTASPARKCQAQCGLHVHPQRSTTSQRDPRSSTTYATLNFPRSPAVMARGQPAPLQSGFPVTSRVCDYIPGHCNELAKG